MEKAQRKRKKIKKGGEGKICLGRINLVNKIFG